jgi:membrane-associated phospholipid phosphatase
MMKISYSGVAFVVAFLIVTALVISKTALDFDVQLALAINRAVFGDTFTAVMAFFSEYGREYFWVSIVAIMIVFGKRETRLLALELAVLFVIGICVGGILKSVIYRPRPFEALSDIITRVPLDRDSSYPSGHGLIVSIGASFSLIKFKRRSVALLLTIEAALVCYSRVYVGMHYPLDVVAGILVGVAIAMLGLPILDLNLHDALNRAASLLVKMLGDGLITL